MIRPQRRPRGLSLVILSLIAVVAALALPPWTPASAANSPPTLQLIGPGAAEAPLLALIGGAHSRVLVEAFALDDAPIVAALQAAARRGVDVRVMLDPQGLNTAVTLRNLQSAGIRTRAPNPSFAVTHMNALVVDATAAAVCTAALTANALGPYGAGYTVVDRDRYDVLQAASVFYDDWLRRPVNSFGHNLIVLPGDAARVAALIDGTGRRLELYTSYLSDAGVLSSLQAARQRGVVVRVLTPRGSNNPSLLTLVAAHGQVRFRDDGAGTALVLDRRVVLLGSMDLASSTLSEHREMGVLLAGQPAAALIDRLFFSEFARGTILTLPPVKKPSKGHKVTTKPVPSVTVGSLKASADVSPLVRPGGQGIVAVTTAPGASVAITITYPAGSAPAHGTTGASGQAGAHGAFVYRWILSGTIKPGTASVHIRVRGKGATATLAASFTVPR